MLKLFSKYTLIIAAAFVLFVTSEVGAQQVNWLSWEEAMTLASQEGNSKKIFVDVYTDWCGWCKKMDKDTFQNPTVATYMEQNFYMVKLDAEDKNTKEFKGQTFNFVPSGRRGYNQLAAYLLNGRLSYPTVVFMDEKLNLLSPVPGYQKPGPFLNIARFFGDNIYLEKSWKDYSGQK